ncbi:RNA polymerase sigma-70 factor [Metabacillus arenae]|uniref:RNA polymerase sigma-70 factor n=1 Tax=Metabacillus arenae TaxID=2771434 RepID=A0A926S057_9BACI|nr:RNA polymerase sigma-70 factor [Metabacillus arenae]MBD1382922.1 RNA polymerase sigma-70 factor [Metabacillus arenae]
METEELYHEYKPLLFSLAYRMLGSVMDAEDIVHDAFLSFNHLENKETIKNPKAFLCKIVTNRTIDKLRSAAHKRNEYVGTWLPEPLVEEKNDPSHSYIMKESISMAYLLLLQQLSEIERAVFILREVFQYEYDEIADIVDKKSTNCRQIFHRAKKSMGEEPKTSKTELAKMTIKVEQFIKALQRADISQMLETLRGDAVFKSDGGGKVKTAINPIYTAERIVQLFISVIKKLPEGASFKYKVVNDRPGIVVNINELAAYVVSFEFIDDKISTIFMMANPDKLVHINRTASGSLEL